MPDYRAQMLGAQNAQSIKCRFEQAVFFIAFGLVEKDSLFEKDPHKYPYSSVFRHGLNMLAAMGAEHCDNPRAFLYGLNESSFIRDMATKDVSQWVASWRPNAKEAIETSALAEVGPLAEADGGFFAPTPECFEILRFAEADLLAAYQERKVYEFLRAGSQSRYVLGRRLLVRHPILTWDEYVRLKTARFDFSADKLDKGEGESVDQKWLEEFLSLAYEPVPSAAKICPTCGWTMAMRGKQAHCISSSCTRSLPSDFSSLDDVPHDAFRLVKGVMHYISAPGGLEIAVAEEAYGLGLEFELWPMKDTGDVLIADPGGRSIVVDAKAYGSAEKLAQEIRNDSGIARLGADEVVYVVPDSVEEEHRGYCAICNKALDKKEGYSCCTYREFIGRLRAMRREKR